MVYAGRSTSTNARKEIDLCVRYPWKFLLKSTFQAIFVFKKGINFPLRILLLSCGTIALLITDHIQLCGAKKFFLGLNFFYFGLFFFFAAQVAMGEIKNLEHLPKHPNLVQYKGYHMRKDAFWVVIEFCDMGDLSDYYKKYFPSKIPLAHQIHFMYQVREQFLFTLLTPGSTVSAKCHFLSVKRN